MKLTTGGPTNLEKLLRLKTLMTSMFLKKESNMKYVQVVVPDLWLSELKKKCVDEKVTLSKKLLSLIAKEIGELLP